MVRQSLNEARLDGHLMSKHFKIKRQLIVRSDDYAFAAGVKLGSSSASENLRNIKNTEVRESTRLRIVDLKCSVVRREKT
jgi:hypothetical protein